MYVISAKVKYDFEDEAILRFAGRDGRGGFGTRYPCWCHPQDKDVEYFNTVEEAEDWCNKCIEYLTDRRSTIISELAVTEVVYNVIKPLSLETSFLGKLSN